MNKDHAKWNGIKLFTLKAYYSSNDITYYIKVRTVFDNRYVVEFVEKKDDASVFDQEQSMAILHDLRFLNKDIAIFIPEQNENITQAVKNDMIEFHSEQL